MAYRDVASRYVWVTCVECGDEVEADRDMLYGQSNWQGYLCMNCMVDYIRERRARQ